MGIAHGIDMRTLGQMLPGQGQITMAVHVAGDNSQVVDNVDVAYLQCTTAPLGVEKFAWMVSATT